MAEIADIRANLNYAHHDKRRAIWEKFEGGNGEQLFDIYGDPDEILELGRHAHKQIHETFTLLKGSGKVVLAPESNPEAVTSRPFRPGSVIEVPPGTIHLFQLHGGSIMTCQVKGIDEEHQPGKDVILYPDFGK